MPADTPLEAIKNSSDNRHESKTERKAALLHYLMEQVEIYVAHPEKGRELASQISGLKNTLIAKELYANYLSYKALDLAGYLELPEQHRAGVTWDMLSEVIEALPKDDSTNKLDDISSTIQDPTIPLEERRLMLNDYLRHMLHVRNLQQNEDTDMHIAYRLAGILGSPTAKEMREDYQYYLCLDVATNLALPEAQRSIGTWHMLAATVRELAGQLNDDI